MLFTGHSEVSIDSKLRLAIPAKYRNQWNQERDGHAWYCVPWPHGILRLYTETQFLALAERFEATLTPDEDEAQLDAELFGLAERLEMDAQGRIVLPKHHLKLTGLGREIEVEPGTTRFETREVVVVGARHRMEVRDRETWQGSQQDRFARLPSLVERVDARKGAK